MRPTYASLERHFTHMQYAKFCPERGFILREEIVVLVPANPSFANFQEYKMMMWHQIDSLPNASYIFIIRIIIIHSYRKMLF